MLCAELDLKATYLLIILLTCRIEAGNKSNYWFHFIISDIQTPLYIFIVSALFLAAAGKPFKWG